jgi:hypothetical protein
LLGTIHGCPVWKPSSSAYESSARSAEASADAASRQSAVNVADSSRSKCPVVSPDIPSARWESSTNRNGSVASSAAASPAEREIDSGSTNHESYEPRDAEKK